MDGSALKELWVSSVRALVGARDYRVGKSWNETFDRVAVLLDEQGIDAKRYVECQIRFMITQGHLERLFPNVLSGPAALQRYTNMDSPTFIDVAAGYSLQAKCFAKVAQNLGENYALTGEALDFTPLFRAFMYYCANRVIPDELRQKACREIAETSMVLRIFPPPFIARIQG